MHEYYNNLFCYVHTQQKTEWLLAIGYEYYYYHNGVYAANLKHTNKEKVKQESCFYK